MFTFSSLTHSLKYIPKFNFSSNCDIHEGSYPYICEFCNKELNNKFPLLQNDFERSFTAGDVIKWIAFKTKISSKQPIVIAVIGGSMTYGHNCNDRLRGTYKECAWPSILQKMFKLKFPDSTISVKNFAIPAFSYSQWVQNGHLLREIIADLFIVDLSVNSQIYSKNPFTLQYWLDYFLMTLTQNRKPGSYAVHFVETFRTCAYHKLKECDSPVHCIDENNRFSFNPNISGVLAEYSWCGNWWSIQDIERPVLSHYNISISSYRDAVWPDQSKPSVLLPCFWNGLSHADANGHVLVAEVVMFGIIQMIDLVSSSSLPYCARYRPYHKDLKIPPYCDNSDDIQTALTVFKPNKFLPVFQSGNWKFREDRPSKFGWIAESSRGSRDDHKIIFNVSVSKTPQIDISFLTSYENICRAWVVIADSLYSLENNESLKWLAKYDIDARNQQRLSISRTVRFIPRGQEYKEDSGIYELPSAVRNGSYYLMFVLQTNVNECVGFPKFKLLSIISC